MRENCAYVATIYKKTVFKDFCVGNTAMFWHKILLRLDIRLLLQQKKCDRIAENCAPQQKNAVTYKKIVENCGARPRL